MHQIYICGARYTCLSNHNAHKSLCDVCFWALDPLIDRFYSNLSGAQKTNARRTFMIIEI